MRIAIIGAGFAGLSIAWHFHCAGISAITLFDKVGVGGGSSGMAAGLLHPYGGTRARLNPLGLEGMSATRKLLDVASKYFKAPVFIKSGLYRIPVHEEQFKEFRISAELYGFEWQKYMGQEALFIPDAITVDCPLYLNGLWSACREAGSQLKIQEVASIEPITAQYDIAIIAAGADSLLLDPSLPLKKLKGQILVLPKLADIQTPFTTQAYVIPQEDTLIVGATFERVFTHEDPDPGFTAKTLLSPLESLIPGIIDTTILSCRAGLRATTPDRLPLVKQLSEKVWVAAGLGSKGLLYHGLLGEKVVKSVLG